MVFKPSPMLVLEFWLRHFGTINFKLIYFSLMTTFYFGSCINRCLWSSTIWRFEKLVLSKNSSILYCFQIMMPILKEVASIQLSMSWWQLNWAFGVRFRLTGFSWSVISRSSFLSSCWLIVWVLSLKFQIISYNFTSQNNIR